MSSSKAPQAPLNFNRPKICHPLITYVRSRGRGKGIVIKPNSPLFVAGA